MPIHYRKHLIKKMPDNVLVDGSRVLGSVEAAKDYIDSIEDGSVERIVYENDEFQVRADCYNWVFLLKSELEKPIEDQEAYYFDSFNSLCKHLLVEKIRLESKNNFLNLKRIIDEALSKIDTMQKRICRGEFLRKEIIDEMVSRNVVLPDLSKFTDDEVQSLYKCWIEDFGKAKSADLTKVGSNDSTTKARRGTSAKSQ